jgi:hypothetical protein
MAITWRPTSYFNFQHLCIFPIECIYVFHIILRTNDDHFLKHRYLTVEFLMVKCYVFFETWNEFLNILQTRFGFTELGQKENKPNFLNTNLEKYCSFAHLVTEANNRISENIQNQIFQWQ